MSGKRGQASGGGAAALVAIIALLIVLYVILLPPDERASLLDENSNYNSGSSDLVDNELVLLDESPGRLDYLAFDEFEHSISPIYLLKSTESEQIKQWNSFTVKNGVFDKKSYVTRFAIPDPAHTNNLLLSFVAPEHDGSLVIRLNDQEIFDGEIDTFNPDPLALPEELLDSSNTLEFEVSSVGWQFWTTNKYAIDGMKIIAQITDTSRQESRNSFVIRDMEYFNLDQAILKFNPHCSPNTVGQMEITLNNQLLYTGIPDCGIPNTKEFSPGQLNRGQNTLIFKTLSGSYLVDGIMVKTSLKEAAYPLYHFEINESILGDIEDNNLKTELRMSFLDEPGRKQGLVYINGRAFSFSETDANWDKDISNQVEEGDNWIKVVPDRGILEIIKLQAVLVEDDN